MKSLFWIAPAAALALSFSSCTNQGSGEDPLGTGPYDAQGNYREDLADDPSKWSKPGKRTPAPIEEPPMIASHDQPPASSTPLTSSTDSSQPRETSRPTSSGPVEVASRSRSGNSSSTKTTARNTTKSSSPKSSTKSSTAKTSSTKKSTAKTKTPTKPKSTRYVVKSGDSLSKIASKTGSSVSAIQKANGLKGTLIRPGQSLVVPKR